MRVKTLLMRLLGLCRATVVQAWELIEEDRDRPLLRVRVRAKVRRRGRCGRCDALSSWYDRGGRVGTDGELRERSWRHVDVGYAICELVGAAPRVNCVEHGPTVAAVPWARHGSAFTRAFEDLVVWEAVVSNKSAAAELFGISWRAVNNICVRVATEALGRVDLLDGLKAIAIDEVKYKKGQKYLTVVCDHVTGNVIWAAKGRSQATLRTFFDDLGDERSAELEFITGDGAEWLHTVVAERAAQATVCLDTFHVVSWATKGVDEVRRVEWNKLRQAGNANAAKEFKGLRFLLLRNWENLTRGQRAVIRDLEAANRRMFRAWQLKEELREIMSMPLIAARSALDDWIAYASRSRLEPFVKLARTVRHFRAEIEATIEYKLTNGIAESNNASIGRIRANARGFHDPDAFINMIMLDRGGLTPQLPWAS